MCAMARPYHAINAPDLFIESEQKRTLIDLGYNDRWKMNQQHNLYKKEEHLRHNKEELTQMKSLKNSAIHLVKNYGDEQKKAMTRVASLE